MANFDDYYLSLPEDPELAFVEYEGHEREAMWAAIENSQSVSYNNDKKIEYASRILAFHDAHNFQFLTDPNLKRSYAGFSNAFDEFMDEITYCTTEIKVRHAKRLRPISTILHLSPEIKQQLHSYISKIRDVVTPIAFSPKKEAILGRLNALADEIDRDRTKTEALTAFILEVASASGQAAKELEPVRKLTDSITALLGKVKELASPLGLPAPATPRRIEAPQKRLPSPEPVDEAPF